MPRGGQERLVVYDNEPLARLAEARLREAGLPCVVKSLGVGPGGWGVASSLPHAVYVDREDLERAREVLGLEEAPRPGEGEPRPGGSGTLITLLSLLLALAVLLALALVWRQLPR